MVCPIPQGDHKKEDKQKKPQDKNIMACPITQSGHNDCMSLNMVNHISFDYKTHEFTSYVLTPVKQDGFEIFQSVVHYFTLQDF